MQTMRMRWSRPWLVVVVLAWLGACSPGGGPSVFVAGNRWLGAMPEGATEITSAEFERLHRNQALVIALEDDGARQTSARDRAFLAARGELASLSDPSGAIQDLIAFAMDEDGHGDLIETETEAGAYALLGVGDQVASALAAAELAQDPDNARADYGLSYGLLDEALRADLPSPASLAGANLSEIRAALAQLDQVLAEVADLDGVAYLPGLLGLPGVPDLAGPMQLQTDGDQTTACRAPTGYVADYWYPLRNFVSPMKDQARRGTCWSFTAIGAVESRELVQNYRSLNLSEQFLVNQVKYRWERSDYTEGYSPDRALRQAIDNGFGLPPESAWVYNRSAHRANTTEGSAADFVGTCQDYGGGTCSETAHQSHFYCTVLLGNIYCGYSVSSYTGPSTPASSTTQIWKTGDTFELNRYRQYLARGHVIMAAFPVYRGFSTPVNGVVTDYAKECDVNGAATKKCGGHLVQIVGFLSNEQLATVAGPARFGGGGVFVVKNSWGCDWGDGGYVYVPADYVQQVFTHMSVLDFDGTRSSQWRQEQNRPGSYETPVVSLTGHSATADLRVPIDLAAFFDVSHSATASVDLRVTSSISGLLHNGPYTIKVPAFGSPTLPISFPAAGSHRLTVTAGFLGRSASVEFDLQVVNRPPVVAFSTSGSPQQGTAFPIIVTVSDRNESDMAGLCSRMNWTVGGDGVVSGSGCQVNVTWPAQGSFTVVASTTDREGLAGSASLAVEVGPPPVNPYPRIASASLTSHEEWSNTCIRTVVPNYGTADLRRDGCLNASPREPRYRAEVTVENPDNEVLGYSWRLYVTEEGRENLILADNTTAPRWHPDSPGNSLDATLPCRIQVTVNAPDPSRSKTQTVWIGTCIYYTFRLGHMPLELDGWIVRGRPT